MTRSARIVLAGVVIAAGWTGQATLTAEAAGPVIQCESTITVDTTLHRDLVGCANTGIVIGADGVTLNLNGHTISGDHSPFEACSDGDVCDVGVANVGGFSGVTIRGGSVESFSVGVLTVGSEAIHLSHLSVSRSLYSGIIIVEAPDAVVDHTSTRANGLTTEQAGLAVIGSERARIVHNQFAASDVGLFAVDGDDHSLIGWNTFRNNLDAGMTFESSRSAIVHNRFARNGDGISVVGDDNTISHNDVRASIGCGGGCGIGISLEGGFGNEVTRNRVTSAKTLGIRIDAYAGTTNGNVIRRNVVSRSGTDGIAISTDHVGDATHTLLERNLVFGNGDDGIDVDGSSTTLLRNTAVHNGDLGIEAVEGVNDAGGNHAAANGDPRQCTNVDCRP